VGGNKQKSILPNIYLEKPPSVDVKIEYEQDGEKKASVSWDNTSRSLIPFNSIRVFDSEYLEGLLDRRFTDFTLVEPFGLHLFQYLIDRIDFLKEKLKKRTHDEKEKKPIIQAEFFLEAHKKSIEEHNCSDQTQSELERLFTTFTDDKREQIEKIEKQIKTLNQESIGDKIKLETQQKRHLTNIKNLFVSRYKNLQIEITSFQKLITSYHQFKKESDNAKKQFEVLNKIPQTNSEKWKKFLDAGNEYSEDIEDSNKICVYCRQPLLDDALSIVKAYGLYLSNESEQSLKQTTQGLESLQGKINKLNLDFDPDEETKKLLENYFIEDNPQESLYSELLSLKQGFDSSKNILHQSINDKNSQQKTEINQYNSIIEKVEELIENIDKKIEQYSSEKAERKKLIEDLQLQLAPLITHRSVFQQKEELKKWFEIHQEQVFLTERQEGIKTRKFSTLADKAHSELLTENLRLKFVEELKDWESLKIKVHLEKAGTSKGRSSTKLTLIKDNNIKAILSEGEQKAVALALFIAELRMQKISNPVIFDDPVNSLDHKMAENFANSLLLLDNQVIVFSHNKLFLNALENSRNGHPCKNLNNGCSKNKGKHLFLYDIQSEGKNSKGVITPRNENKAETHIKKAKKLLNKSPFQGEIEVAGLIRKSIECLIDEKVLRGIIPTKLSTKSSKINWDALKKVGCEESVINSLHKIHGRVSGGTLHNGAEAEENPPEKEDFVEMIEILDNF